MKTFTINIQSTILTLAIILIATIATSAAKVYQGYVILNDDSQLDGKIQMLSPTLNEVKVKIITTEGLKISYKAKDVKEYGFKVEKLNKTTNEHQVKIITYKRKKVVRNTVAFGAKNVLIQRELDGAISLYNHFYQRNSNIDGNIGHSFYVEEGNGELIWLTKEKD